MNHTPTPWRLDNIGNIITPNGKTLLFDGIAQPFHTFKNGKQITNPEVAQAAINKAHVLKCVNSHASLVAALKKIIEMNRATADAQYGDPDKAEGWGCVTTAREALKKAGIKQPKIKE